MASRSSLTFRGFSSSSSRGLRNLWPSTSSRAFSLPCSFLRPTLAEIHLERLLCGILCVCRFLTNFAKRTFTMNESIKLVHDFLDFIALRMGEVEPWKSMAEAELDMALEGMEKLVMNVNPFTLVVLTKTSS